LCFGSALEHGGIAVLDFCHAHLKSQPSLEHGKGLKLQRFHARDKIHTNTRENNLFSRVQISLSQYLRIFQSNLQLLTIFIPTHFLDSSLAYLCPKYYPKRQF